MTASRDFRVQQMTLDSSREAVKSPAGSEQNVLTQLRVPPGAIVQRPQKYYSLEHIGSSQNKIHSGNLPVT